MATGGKDKTRRAIDLSGLDQDDIGALREFADFLRCKAKHMESGREQPDVNFASWPLGTRGSLTRWEIYDHL